jgi:hypothetical protein
VPVSDDRAVSVTAVPSGKDALHAEAAPLQEMPAGWLSIERVPGSTRRLNSLPKVAIAVRSDVIATEHAGAEPSQAPDQPAKYVPEGTATVIVRWLPAAKDAEQPLAQVRPAGSLRHDPPGPLDATVSR